MFVQIKEFAVTLFIGKINEVDFTFAILGKFVKLGWQRNRNFVGMALVKLFDAPQSRIKFIELIWTWNGIEFSFSRARLVIVDVFDFMRYIDVSLLIFKKVYLCVSKHLYETSYVHQVSIWHGDQSWWSPDAA